MPPEPPHPHGEGGAAALFIAANLHFRSTRQARSVSWPLVGSWIRSAMSSPAVRKAMSSPAVMVPLLLLLVFAAAGSLLLLEDLVSNRGDKADDVVPVYRVL
jgi:hypothetical protein